MNEADNSPVISFLREFFEDARARRFSAATIIAAHCSMQLAS